MNLTPRQKWGILQAPEIVRARADRGRGDEEGPWAVLIWERLLREGGVSSVGCCYLAIILKAIPNNNSPVMVRTAKQGGRPFTFTARPFILLAQCTTARFFWGATLIILQ